VHNETPPEFTPDNPLTRFARELHEDDVDWPKTATGQLDASDRLLQCDDPGIPQPYGALHSRAKLILASPINLDFLVANLVSQTPNSVPRKWIPPPPKRQKWLPGFDNGTRVVARPHGSNRHPMDPTRTATKCPLCERDHSQLDAAPSANGDRRSRPVGFAALSDCPSHHPNCASATHPRTKPGAIRDATPRLMSDFDSLQMQKDPGQDLGQNLMSACNSVDWKGEEANLAPVGLDSVFFSMTSVPERFDWKEDEANLALVGLDSVFLLMTSVLEGFVEWHWRQPRLDSDWAQHAMISCV
jgi:hypothetical protein